MTKEPLQVLYHAQPFQPFVVRLADGGQIPVRQRECFAIGPRGGTIAVFQPDGSLNIINLAQVVALEILPESDAPAPTVVVQDAGQ
jgi:hypothetical protein